MKRIFKVLESTTGREFFVFANKLPKIKNIVDLCCKEFCRTEEEIRDGDFDGYFIDEIKPINIREKTKK